MISKTQNAILQIVFLFTFAKPQTYLLKKISIKKNIQLVATLFITSLSIISCTKEEVIPKNDTSTIVAAATIDAANSFDLQTGIQINTKENITRKIIATTTTCATITVDNANNYPKTFTVDYGTGCTINSITRKGKLKITVSAAIYETGSKMTIERMDYSINNLKLEGIITYTNTTTDANVPQWTRTVRDGKLTYTDGKIYLNSGSYTMKQTAGVSTPFLLSDNTYEMT